jgi:S2P endopeptidase
MLTFLLLSAVGIWLVLFAVLKFALLQLSDDALDRLPFEISLRPFFLRLDSLAFNRPIGRLARSRHRASILRWFQLAAIFGGIVLVASPLLIAAALWQTLGQIVAVLTAAEPIDAASVPVMVLTPIIPGLNVPAHELLLYFAALALGATVHEFGHAVAAAALECRLNSVGFFLAFIAPGVFVDMNRDDLLALPPLDQLKVYAAGAWHNAVLAAFALLLLLTQSIWLAPLFVANGNGGVTTMPQAGSPLDARLLPHDRVVAVDDCRVANSSDWWSCLGERAFNASDADLPPLLHVGYCVDDAELERAATSDAVNSDCCEPSSSAPYQCFRVAAGARSFCLASAVYEPWHRHFGARCADDSDCSGATQQRHCVLPSFVEPWERLIRFEAVAADGAARPPIMYRGPAESVWQTVDVSDLSSRWALLSALGDAVGANVDQLPALLARLWQYVVSLNAGMALLSVAPFYKWDGEFALPTLLALLGVGRRNVARWTAPILRAGSALIVATLLASFVLLWLETAAATAAGGEG